MRSNRTIAIFVTVPVGVALSIALCVNGCHLFDGLALVLGHLL